MSENVVLYIVGTLMTIVLAFVGATLNHMMNALKCITEELKVSRDEGLERFRVLELQLNELHTEHNIIHASGSYNEESQSCPHMRGDKCFISKAREPS